MIYHITFPFAYLAFTVSSIRAQPSKPIDSKHGVLPPPLSLAMFQNSLLSSMDDIDEPVDFDVNSWWENYTINSWDFFMESGHPRSPFLVCHGGENMSGRERSDDVLKFFSNLDNGATYSQVDVAENIIYNTEILTCLFAVALPSTLVNLQSYETSKNVPIAIQPLVSEMKAAVNLGSIITDSEFISEWWGVIKNVTDFREKLPKPDPEDIEGTVRRRQQSGNPITSSSLKLQATTCQKIPENEAERKNFQSQILQNVNQYISLTLEADDFNVGIARIGKMPNISPEKCSMWLLPSSIKLQAIGNSRTIKIEIPRTDGTLLENAWIPRCVGVVLSVLLNQMEICHLSVRPDAVIRNMEARWITQGRGVSGYSPFYDAGLNGEGQIVAVSDTGLDTKSCYFRDETHVVMPQLENVGVDTAHRKVVQYIAYADQTDAPQGHGTHVVGSIVGRSLVEKPLLGTLGTKLNQNGIAENAKISFYDIGDSSQALYVPYPYNQVLIPGYDAGAKVHSASWGSVNVNYYSEGAAEFDEFMYYHQDFLILVAAGNSGDAGLNTVSDPATAKNIISVGATESLGSSFISGMQGMDYLASFSSRGPTKDGRIKPDVVAPGFFVASASAVPQSESCALRLEAGTSMSTPITAGNALLVRQYFEEGFHKSGKKNVENGIKPTAALVKAVLMNGAQYILGVSNQGVTSETRPYDENQGFGRISLLDSLPLAGHNTINGKYVDGRALQSSKNDFFNITVDNQGGKCESSILSVTLVWTDHSSRPSCSKCLLNDLDLVVVMDGVKYHPNGRDNRDDINNAERIKLDVKNGDTLIIGIAASNLVTEAQHYAMAMTGCFNVNSESFESIQDHIPKAKPGIGDINRTKWAPVVIVVVLVTCISFWFIRKKMQKNDALRLAQPTPEME